MPDAAPVTTKIPSSALPRNEEGQLDWLRLARSRRVGPATFIRLLREHGDVAAALATLPRIAAEAGVSGYRCTSREEAVAEWRKAKAAGARALFLGAADYPPLLALLPDPPPFLWAIGEPAIATRSPVAIVGARNASGLGRRMARGLAAELGSAGHAIASGLARGIDAAAHEAALETGTIAVLAGGIDVIYPPENAKLAAAIAERGLILSEMPMATPPKASLFLRRNRLVSGLSLGVVVVEAAERSGAVNTARTALDQGREVMAVPGSPLDPRAGGCNTLLRDGATLVRSAADVLEALDIPVPRPAPKPTCQPDQPPPGNAALPLRLLALLGPAPLNEDSLIRETGAGAAAVAAALLDLEIAGRVQRHPGGLVSRAPG